MDYLDQELVNRYVQSMGGQAINDNGDYGFTVKGGWGQPESQYMVQNVNDDPRYKQYAQNTTNQDRMRQWAGGPVKRQNRQAKNAYIGMPPVIDDGSGRMPRDLYAESQEKINSNRMVLRRNGDLNGIIDSRYLRISPETPEKVISHWAINRLAGPIGALPMVAPEALGMIGAAQEARRQGVNPMVNWLQRMTPVPVVAPTGNGGEVYNYQSGQRYTPEY